LQGYRVIAADVNINGPIQELGCEAMMLDITSENDIELFANDIGDQPIDLLLNVAGQQLIWSFKWCMR
jgi:short-subunit dehydrogenase